MVVLDTNVVLYALKGALSTDPPERGVIISVITEIELLSYPGITEVEQAKIIELISRLEVAPLDDSVKARCIELRRTDKLRIPDAIVLATAAVRAAELWTNDKQLLEVQGVKCRRVSLKDETV